MTDKILIDEKTLEMVFRKLGVLKIMYQQKSGSCPNERAGRRYLGKAQEVDELMTAIAIAMDEAEEAEYQAMCETPEQE